MAGEKHRRQVALRRLAAEQAFSNQAEAVAMLERTGFQATQASVSRDMRELGLVKLNGRYVSADGVATGASHAADAEIGELITKCDPVGANLIVVRTTIGAANTVAVALDRKESPDIAGTVAGDDTFFIAIKSRSAQGRVLALLRGMMRR
jgi:transcriptional regulator of arginine metabolism